MIKRIQLVGDARLVGRRRFAVRLAIALLCAAGLTAPPAAAASKYRSFTNAKWKINQGYADTQVSADRKTLTTRLPPSSTIDDNFTGRFSGIDMEFGSGVEYHPSAGADILPSGTPIQCFYDRNNALLLACRADTTWLRTLNSETTVQLRVKGFGNTVRMLDWRFEPAAGDVFIDRIDGSGSAEKGRPYDFTLRLTEPAPEGGLQIMWRIDPAGCFSRLTGGVPYSSAGALNLLEVPEGTQYKAVSVSVEMGCSSGGATLRTWVHQQLDRTPYYLTKSIRLTEPPRRR